jgi:hypothetical protein
LWLRPRTAEKRRCKTVPKNKSENWHLAFYLIKCANFSKKVTNSKPISMYAFCHNWFCQVWNIKSGLL